MSQNENNENAAGNSADTLELLSRLKREAFDGDDEQLALALGRPASEVMAWFTHGEEIDDDGAMKIHGLAQERLGE